MSSFSALVHRLMQWREDDKTILSFIRRRVRELTQRVADKEASVSKEEIDELERLSSLAAIHEATRSRAVMRGAAVVLSLGLFLIGLAVMLTPVRETNVVLTMATSELGFRIASSVRLTETVPVVSLEANGIRGIKLEDYKGQPEAFLPSDQLRIAPSASSTISLSPLHVPSKTKVTAAYVPPHPLQFRIQVEDPSIEATANLKGSAVLLMTDQTQRVTYPYAQAITIVRQGGVLDLTVAVPDTSTDLFFRPLRISELEPFRIVDNGSTIDSVSTLRTARLIFTEMNSSSREIHPSEVVKLKIVSDGTLRELSLHPDHFVADFTGKVHNVIIGDASVMPTRFEWLAAQNAAAVLWSVATSILVTFFAVWRWLRRPT
jgi:hypothetical protein